MNNLNSLIIEGNVVRQSKITEPTPGFKVLNFPVAVNRWYKNRDNKDASEVSYFDVCTYGKMAEFCESQIKKGRGVRVVGRIKQERWKDQEGKQKSKVVVIAEHIEYKPILDSHDENQTDGENVSEEETSQSIETDNSSMEEQSEEVMF